MSYVTYTELSAVLGDKLGAHTLPPKAALAVPDKLIFSKELTQFVMKMHEKHPRYTFQPRYFNVNNVDGLVIVHEFVVSLGTDTLGKVRYFSGRFTLTGDRITEARRRTNDIRTKDSKRAAREFTKYFRPMTEAESFKDQVRLAHATLFSARTKMRESKAVFTSLVDKFLLSHIADNFERYADIAKSAGASEELIEKAKSEYDNSCIIDSAVSLEGYIVGTRTNRYIVSDRNGRDVTVYEAGDLPKNINDKLGKLKLLQRGTYIRDTGLCIDDHTFFVTEQSDE